jgi:hypothetical protein
MKSLIWVMGLFTTTNAVHAGLIAQQSILDLAQTADAVVVGSASGTFVWGSGANLTLAVTRVVKGPSAIAGTSIAVRWDMGPNGLLVQPGATTPVAGDGIWFLQNNGGSWSLLPVEQGSITFEGTYYPAPLSPLPAVYSYASAAPVTDKVASEVEAAIEALSGNYNQQLYGLIRGQLLDQLNSSVTSVLYQRLANSASVPQQILGLAGLIRTGALSGIASAVSFSASSFSSRALEYGILLSAIRDESRPSDATSIALLGQTATDQNNPNTALREAAAHALASVHSAATLPYLATLLGDPDSTLRVEGIGGMAAFANGLPVQTSAQVASLSFLQLPASAPYRTADTMAHFAMGSTAIERSEASYLSFWQQWWQQNQAGLGF